MKTIYLEPDEEIISIIEKVSGDPASEITIVVPKNSTLFQSLVNLRLLAKSAKEQKKTIGLVTKDRVGERLAKQIGLPVYASAPTLPPPRPDDQMPTSKGEAVRPAEQVTETLPDGTTIHRFVPPSTASSEIEPETEPDATETPPEVEPVSVEAPTDEPIHNIIEKTETVEPEQAEPRTEIGLPAIASRSWGQTREPFSWRSIPWKSMSIATLILLVAASLVYTFLPKAIVSLNFPSRSISKSLDLTVKIADATGETMIPGSLVSAEKSAEKVITATGKKDIGTKATGSITLYNKASSSSVTLALGTTIVGSGKNFTLIKAVTIPGASVSGGSVVAGQVAGAVTASAAGEDYNLTNVQFSVTGQPALVYGSGSTTGGSTKQVTVLSQEDQDKAVTEMKASLQTDGLKDLAEKASGQTVLDGSISTTVKTQSVDKEVGSQTDQATLKMTVGLSVIAFDKDEANQKLVDLMTKNLTGNEQLSIPEDKPATQTYKSINSAQSEMVITIAGVGFAAPTVDKITVAKRLNNLSISKASGLLTSEFPGAEVAIKMVPGWWSARTPLLWQAIQINYSYHEITGN